MSREIREIADAVNKIKMKPEMEDEILENLKKMETGGEVERRFAEYGKGNGKNMERKEMKRKAAVAAACILAVGIIGMPVKALVDSVVQERMEQIPEEEIEETAEMLAENSASVEADGFSRDFSEAENVRMIDLAVKYNQGLFPEKEMPEVENDAAAIPDQLCYSMETGTYFLPERELTDEELLQYIDYQQKLNYVLAENNKEEGEVQQETDEQENAAKPGKITAGISEAEASAEGAKWLKALFDKDTAGLEENCYLLFTGEEEAGIDTLKYKSQYMSYFGVIHDNYYLYIDAETGELAQADHSCPVLDTDLTQKEAEGLLEENKEEAEKILREKLKKTEPIAHVYGSYVVNEEGIVERGRLAFHFVTEDGTDYILAMQGSKKELVKFVDTYYEDYIKMRDEQEKMLRERYDGTDMELPPGERIIKEMK